MIEQSSIIQENKVQPCIAYDKQFQRYVAYDLKLALFKSGVNVQQAEERFYEELALLESVKQAEGYAKK